MVLSKRLRGVFPWSLEHIQLKRQNCPGALDLGYEIKVRTPSQYFYTIYKS